MNAHVYNAAVSLYASVGDLETALGWMDRMAAGEGGEGGAGHLCSLSAQMDLC